MVFKENLGPKAGFHASIMVEQQLGILEEAECTQIDQWCGKLSVLKLYESPADAAKLLAIDTCKGLLLNKKVLDSERGENVLVEKEVHVMVCRLQDEDSLGGFAEEGTREPGEKNKQVIIQRTFGALDPKGPKSLEHRRAIATKILEAVIQANPDAGARLLMDGLALPLENDSLKAEGKKYMVGWMVWLAAESPLFPPADGQMWAGYGQGKKRELMTRLLSMHPSKGARGFTALSWPGYKSLRGALVPTSSRAPARGPVPQSQEVPQMGMPPPPDRQPRREGGGGTWRGTQAGTRKKEGPKEAYTRSKESLSEGLRPGFDALLNAWDGRGSPPCFTAALRVIEEGDHGPCKEGTACYRLNKFYPCNTKRGVSGSSAGAVGGSSGAASGGYAGGPPLEEVRDAGEDRGGEQERRWGPVQSKKQAVAGSEWVREAKEHRERLVEAGVSQAEAAFIAMATQEQVQARLNEQLPEPQVFQAQQVAAVSPQPSAAEVARERREAREGKPGQQALFELISQVALMKRRELSMEQVRDLAETQFKAAMEGAGRAGKEAAEFIPAWQKQYDEELTRLRAQTRPRETSAAAAGPSPASSGSGSPMHSKPRNTY